jgi:hypothetical protein
LKKLQNAVATHASDADKAITRKRLLNDLGVHLAIAELSANKTLFGHLEVIITKILLSIKVARARTVLHEHLMHSMQNATAAQSYLSGNA